MKKHIIYYKNMPGEMLNERKFFNYDLVAACICLAAGLLLFISKKSLPESFIMFFASIIEIINWLIGYYSGKCPCCKNSITVKAHINNYVLYCEKCGNILYKQNRCICKLDSADDRKIRLIPYEKMTRVIIIFFWIEIFAYLILMALGFEKSELNKISYINILPLAIILFASFYNLIQKKTIEVRD